MIGIAGTLAFIVSSAIFLFVKEAHSACNLAERATLPLYQDCYVLKNEQACQKIDESIKIDENQGFRLVLLLIFILQCTLVPLVFLKVWTRKKTPIFKILSTRNLLGIIGSYVLCIIKRFDFPGKICSGHYSDLQEFGSLSERGKFMLCYIIALPIFYLLIIIMIAIENKKNRSNYYESGPCDSWWFFDGTNGYHDHGEGSH